LIHPAYCKKTDEQKAIQNNDNSGQTIKFIIHSSKSFFSDYEACMNKYIEVFRKTATIAAVMNLHLIV
jgi:hypothetical protein